MVVFVGHVNSKSMGRESFQEINQHAFFGDVAKAVLSPENTDDIPRAAAEAVRRSTDGRPGPVVVQIPRDVSSMDTDAEIPNPSPRAVHLPDADMIAKAVTMIDAAKAPLVIAGEIISNQNASTELTDFVAAGGLPVMSAYRRLDVMANSHACYAGHLEINRFESQLAAIEADLRDRGRFLRLDCVSLSADETMLCIGKQLIHIYPDPEILDRSESDVAIDSDMKPALDALRRHLTPPDAQRAARTEILTTIFSRSLNRAISRLMAMSTWRALLTPWTASSTRKPPS